MKVAIYCRLSEEDKHKQKETDDSESIQNQKSMLIQYAVDREWEIHSIYSDDDYTGADRNRPEFNRLLADAEGRKFNIVLCKTQSRFTRELEIVEKYIHGLFPLWGIRFISIVDNADTEVKGNKKSRQINGLINEWYLEDMSENIRSVLTSRRKQGFHIGAFSLYGYIKDPDIKGHLIIDQEAAEVVREVFTLYSQGYGKTAIARILNDRGIPNPTAYRVQKGYPHRKTDVALSSLWKYFSVSDMLINEMYIGNLVQGKYGSISYKTKQSKPISKEKWIRVEGTHEPIINMELWNAVQSKVNANFKPFLITGKIGLFAKKARCMNCGYILRSSKNRGIHYLQCQTKHVQRGACVGAFVGVEKLSAVVLEELKKMIAEYLDMDEVEQKITVESDHQKRRERLLDEVGAYEKRRAELSKAIKDLYVDKVKGIITENDFVEFSKEFYQDKERVEKALSEVSHRLDVLEEEMQTTSDKRSMVAQYANVTQLDRDVVEKLIDVIYVGRRDPETKILPVEIHWNI